MKKKKKKKKKDIDFSSLSFIIYGDMKRIEPIFLSLLSLNMIYKQSSI